MAVLCWMNTIQYSLRIGPLYATGVSQGPPESLTQMASQSLQPFLLSSIGDRPTGRPRSSVFNNRWGARWRSQILLLSTATTSIYWSSRLGRSDQLQQSVARFSCKTRRVAVYVETHYNIASKRAVPNSVLDRWHNCLLIYWCTCCLVPAFDVTWCHVPATEWCLHYLPCDLLSVSYLVCFFVHWPSFALFYWMIWPWSNDVIRLCTYVMLYCIIRIWTCA